MFRLCIVACLVFCVVVILLILPVGQPIGQGGAHQLPHGNLVTITDQHPTSVTTATISGPSQGTANTTVVSDTLIASSAVYIVSPGDTLYAIAVAHHTTVGQLTEINGLNDPNVLYPGQQLIIPAPNIMVLALSTVPATDVATVADRDYTVQSGDTLWQLARQWGTSIQSLMTLNGLSHNETLQVGQHLYIP